MNVAKRVSSAIKNQHPYSKFLREGVARKFAAKMRKNAERVREFGTHMAGMRVYPTIPRDIVNAMCFGCGDEHNRAMIKKYTDAAVAAERFLRR